MNIRHSVDGKILAVGDASQIAGDDTITIDDAALPVDFTQMFGLGKYKVQSGAVVEVPGWVPPPPPAVP